jgi:hypothetical protein
MRLTENESDNASDDAVDDLAVMMKDDLNLKLFSKMI